ncbi:MAG: GLUG motif-containing protein, partial [Acutalibacteraceae bacterium]|nr:GLUG motif-containing protein [Acutalibacteraceae bacterium]
MQNVIVGVNRGLNATVTNFYSLATLVANSKTGIVADTWGPWATVKNAYILGSLDTKANTYATNCYATVAGAGAVVVKQDGMIGDKAALTMPGLGEKFVVTQKYPALLLFTPDAEPGDTIGTSPFIGSGTEEDPYLIITAIDLKNMVGIAGKGAYYKLTNDIYVNDVKAVDWLNGTVNAGYEPEEWFVSHDKDGDGYEGYTSNKAMFSGTIDGNGYAIHGLYYKLGNNSTLAGVIPYSNGVTIKNLGIEDSFIGSGRFTGGFVGYGKAINLSKCYVDDSCAIFGWDAGADYVKSDADIATSGGSGLCSGSIAETIYKEDEAGTYKYDEESGTYVAIAKDEEFTGTRYSVDDIVWNTTVGFMSEALGGLVGRYTATAGTIDNCYVTAIVESHPIYAFGQEGQGVTFKAYGVSGSGMGHVGGLWGDDWASGTTKLVTATNCFSVIRGHENVTNSTFTNIYTLASDAPAGITKISLAVGDKGLDQMPGLDRNVWYAVKGGTKYPQLRIRGAAMGDVNENGTGAEVLDVTLLRKTLIKAETALNTDTNRDGETNICDLVALTKLEGEKTALEQEAAQKLLDTVYLSTAGSDVYNGSSLDKAVATLGKAITLVKDGGTIVVDGTVVVTSVPASAKTVHITGGTLDFSGLSAVNLNTGLIFENGSAIKFADDSNVYANGNTVTVNEGVTVQGTPNAIFGGGVKPVYSTNLTVKSGNYKQIYGGGYKSCVLADTNLLVSGTVNASLPLTAVNSSYIFGGGFQCDVYGNTNVTVSGEVNEPLDHTSHTAIAKLYGGSNTGTVHKNSYVTVLENAEFSYIYGGGAGTCEIVGSTNIDFSGKAMSIYGGSGTVHETNVTVNGGWVHQVFGGLEGGSMTGNTNVTINGGTIDRRVVGGCYNNATRSGLSM